MHQQRSGVITCTILLLSMLSLTLPSTEVRAQEYDDEGSAPQALQDIFEELRLGIRVTTDVQRWSHTATGPLEGVQRGGEYIDAQLQPAVLALYGMEAGLAYRNLEVFGTVKVNDSLQRTSTLQTQAGTVITNVAPDVLQYGVRAQYMSPDVADGLSIGMGLYYRVHQMTLRNPRSQSEMLLSASVFREDVRLYVPVRYDVGPLTTLFTVGGAVTTGHTTWYQSYVGIQPPGAEGPTNSQVDFIYPDESPRTLFATVGVEMPVWGMPMQATLRYERAQQTDVYTESTFGLGLRFGLPF